MFRTQDEPCEFEEIQKIGDNRQRNNAAVELVVSNFKKLLEQSKALEEEVILTRSQVELSESRQSDVLQDKLAMSITCNSIIDDDLKLDDSVPVTVTKLNLNQSNTNLPSVGENLMFVKSKDKF